MPRFLVLENHPHAAVVQAARDFAGDAGLLRSGFEPLRRVVCVGRVATPTDAERAVLAAVAGADLVVDAAADRDVVDQLCDDLRRLGDLEHRVEAPPELPIDADDRELVALLLGGATLGQAASALHMSRRTADRRLLAIRAALGVQTTSEAIAAAARLGLRPNPLP